LERKGGGGALHQLAQADDEIVAGQIGVFVVGQRLDNPLIAQ
jgi:hypothetical protein